MSRKAEFEEILLRMMHEKGYKGTTMRLLAEALDCDVANIYNYLSSKQAKLDEVLFALSDKFHKGVDQIRKSKYDPLEKVRHLVHLYVSMSSDRPYHMSLLVNDWRHLEDGRRMQFIEERRRFESKVLTIISEGIKEGQFKQMDPKVAVHLVLSSTRWLFNYFTGPRDQINPVELERQILIFIEQGLIRR